jgi:membrane-associated phospholipid phosphatase
MVYPDPTAPLTFWPLFWHQITRLGEAQLLLPLLLVLAVWLARRPDGGRLAACWLAATVAAAALTTATKVAFIGWGLGFAPLDFTGVSGHAMFAAAVLPLLVRLVGGEFAPRRAHLLLALGYGLAAMVAVSRVQVGAHSWSEVLSGFALGAVCSGGALWAAPIPALRLARWVPLGLLAWAATGVLAAPPSQTHDLVTRLALAQSGRSQPYHRWEMHRDQRLRDPQRRDPQFHVDAHALPQHSQRAAADAGSLQPR